MVDRDGEGDVVAEGVERQPPLLGRYLRAIDWCLRHRRTTLLTATALFLGTMALGAFVPQGFAPGGDFGAWTAQAHAAPDP